MFRVCWFGQLKGILYPSEGKGNPKIWILPHFISPQKMIFFSIFYQFWSWLTFFIDKLYFQRVWFPLHGFWNKSHDFVGNVNNGFSLKKTSKWRHKYAHHTSNNSSLTSKSDVVTDCLARSVRDRVFAGPKGLKTCLCESKQSSNLHGLWLQLPDHHNYFKKRGNGYT